MFVDNVEIENLETKVKIALDTYKKMPFQEAYILLSETASKVDKSKYWKSFERELGELHYNIAVLLYQNLDLKVIDNFQQINKHFQQSRLFSYQAAEQPCLFMDQCMDPFTGQRLVSMNLNSTWEKKRAELLVRENKEQGKFRDDLFERAKAMFEDYSSLSVAIEKDIFPCVVSIDTGRGFGTGFFEHEKWLVSNAHVLPNSNCIDQATIVSSNFERSLIVLGEEGSFHRPTENAPDITIINVASSNKAVPFTKFSKDQVFPPISSRPVYFCIYVDHVNQRKEIRLLNYNREDDFHLLFNPTIDVGPGCSGSPVFEARVIMGRDPKWQFRTIGAIFARTATQEVNEKLVYAIKIAEDFEQIRQEILLQNQEALRLEKEAEANQISGNEKRAYVLFAEAKKCRLSSIRGFKRYSEETNLLVDLPLELERLLGKAKIDLQGSAFLIEIQQIYKLDTKTHIKKNTRTIKELGEDLYDFFQDIRSIKQLPPRNGQSGNEYLLSPKGYFRIDLAGGSDVSGGGFRFDLQDNIGNKGEHCPHPNGTVPVSSKFAIASISKQLVEATGEELANLLRTSLTLNSRTLLSTVEAKRKEEALPMWRLFCYGKIHNGQNWKSEVVYQSEDAVYESLEFKEHLSHNGIAVKDDKDSNFKLFNS